MRNGIGKQYYLTQDVIDWIAKKAEEDGRKPSNYLVKLVRQLAAQEMNHDT